MFGDCELKKSAKDIELIAFETPSLRPPGHLVMEAQVCRI